MGENFLGEVKLIGFDFAPKNWSYCDGQRMPISQNAALYALMGVQFGGDSQTYFQLPDLRGRVPVHPSPSYGLVQGMAIGKETVALTDNELAKHTHTLKCTTTDGYTHVPSDESILTTAVERTYEQPVPIYERTGTDMVSLDSVSSSSVGGDQAHANLQPSLVIGFIIALKGMFPTRN